MQNSKQTTATGAYFQVQNSDSIGDYRAPPPPPGSQAPSAPTNNYGEMFFQ
jgi:hypothetical protein